MGMVSKVDDEGRSKIKVMIDGMGWWEFTRLENPMWEVFGWIARLYVFFRCERE